MATQPIYASIAGLTDPRAQTAVRLIAEALGNLGAQVQMVASRPMPQLPSYNDIRIALQAGGTNPLILTGLPGAAGLVLIGTHAARPTPGSQATGTLYWETDRTSLYVSDLASGAPAWKFVAGAYYAAFASRPTDLGVNDYGFQFHATDQLVSWYWTGTAFVYLFGIYERTQSQLAALAALLGANDFGYLVSVTDFIHTLLWNGAGWQFGPSDMGSGMIVGFPFTPTAGIWGLCNGATYSYLRGDGTTANFVTPNYAGEYVTFDAAGYVATTAAGGVTAATSGGTPAGTVSAPVFTGTPGTTGTNSANQEVQSGTGVTVADDPHDHAFTPAGTNSAPTFTGSALATHTHGPGTLALLRTTLLPYFRR